MADVKVNIKGNSKDFEKAAENAKKKIKEVSKQAKKSSAEIEAAARLQAVAYDAAFNIISKGFEALAVSAKDTFRTFREESDRSLAAVRAALGNISVEIGNVPGLRFTNRDDLVAFGREAQEQVNQLNAQLDERGLVTRLQENDTVLKGIVNTAVNITGLFSDQVRAQQGQTQALLEQRKLALERVNFAKQQLALLREQKKVQDDATGAGATGAPNFDTGPGRIGGDLLLTPSGGSAPDPFALPSLPDSDFAFGNREFNEEIAEATKNIRDFETAVKAGLVPGFDAAQQRVDLLRERLFVMIENGVSPASSQFQQLSAQLASAEEELEGVGNAALANEVAFTIFSDVANQALDSIIFKTQSLQSALRNVGRQLLSTFLRAGVNFGLAAITGNPFQNFGQALGSAVGVPLSASVPAADLSKPTLSANQLNSFNGLKISVEPTATRISGGDLLLSIRDAQNRAGRGGGRIDLG